MTIVSEEVLLRERRGGVAHLRMNRPTVLNAFDETLGDALRSAFAEVAADESVRAVVLTGAGRSFMAGGDLARFKADLADAPGTATRLIDAFHAVARTIRTMPKPVIAAVQGPIAGGGVGLALACDLVVAAHDATFLSAYAKLGTSPDDGTSWLVTRLIGPRRALAFLLLNERLVAADAVRIGLVNEVVATDDLVTTALSLAERLTANCSNATDHVKRLVQAAQEGDFDTQLDLEKRNFVEAAGSADFREGVTAFFERRPPRFS